MSQFIIGRLFGWPEFAEDGLDLWLVHIDEPAFFMRLMYRPEDLMPTGDLNDMYFPLVDDPRYALGNLMFIEPRSVDPREVAQRVAGAIDAIHDEEVTRRLGFARVPLDPSSAELQREDIPVGFVVGVLHDTDLAMTDPAAWVVNVGPPPFALRVCDLNDEDLDDDEVWATLGDGNALARLVWLSSMSCDFDDMRHLAETAAGLIRDWAVEVMPDLIEE